MPTPCEYRWEASRVEADTLPVKHVCNEQRLHEGDHVCSCGQTTSNTTDWKPMDLTDVQWKGRMVPFSLFIMVQDADKAQEVVHEILDQFPPMNDADVEMVALGEYWIARVTVWWS